MAQMVSEPISSSTESNPLAAIALQQLENELLAWTMNQYSAARTARSVAEQSWYINQAFYSGKQNVRVLAAPQAPGNYTLQTPKAPPWRVRLIVNKIRPIIRTEVAKLTANKPTAVVIPATAEEEDVMAARVGEQIWDACYRDNNVAAVLRDLAWWGTICGTSFIKTFWDPTKAGKKGDITIECVDPFHIFVPDTAEREIENQPFVIHGMTRNPLSISKSYGFDPEPNAKATDPFIENSFLNSMGTTNSRLLKEVACYEVWLKEDAHKDFPEGGLITIVGDKVVQIVKGYPYSHKEFPFAKFEHVQTGKFYGDSVITDLLPLQREYNRTRSQIIEAKNTMAKPRLIAPRGSVNARMISSEPGQVIQYTPGFSPPTTLNMDPLPSYVLEELDRIQSDIDDISGQHEISRGQNPSQVTAASALTYLNEQDESKLAASIASMEHVTEKIARQYLKFVIDYWDVERTVKVTGKNQAFESYAWKNNALKGNTDIRIESGSAMPQSRAAKQAFLMDLFKMGAIPPEQMLETLDMKGLEKTYEDFLVDRRQAQRENLKMVALKDVPPELFMTQPQQLAPPQQVAQGMGANPMQSQPTLPGMPQ